MKTATKRPARVFDDEQVIEAAFRHFRAAGFPYRRLPLHVCMQELNRLAATPTEKLAGTKAGYYVADTYHPHRVAASAEGMRSPLDAFGDDALLRRAIKLKVDARRNVSGECLDTIPVVSGTQACSNFRPGFACKVYREFCRPDSVVLDTSTGYGGRLVGFMASGAGRYIGVDPSTKTHAGNLKMAADLGFADRVELHNLPAEEVPHDVVAGRCDFAFTSPPYFRKEHYSDEPTQSWRRYTTGDEWFAGFLVPMLRLQFAALKPGCFSAVNIADVTLKGKAYRLVDWAITAARAVGFEHKRTEGDDLKFRRYGKGQKASFAAEPLLIFRKPARRRIDAALAQPAR